MEKTKNKTNTSSSSSSWLSIVKRAFRSPVKDNARNADVNDKRNSRLRYDSPPDHDHEEKKREKRRWLFRKPSRSTQPHNAPASDPEVKEPAVEVAPPRLNPVLASTEQRHAIAVAAAKAATAEAAMATAQAAMEIARLARSTPQQRPPPSPFPKKHHGAALVIQTAFRGYLARRALRALKGLVRLQALVRGHNVRKQAKLTLRCMQALVRVQDRMRDQRARLSHDGVSRKSMFSESNNLWESSYLRDIRERRSTSRNTSCCTADFWDEKEQQPATKMMDEIKAVLQVREREKTLANAFSQQIGRSRRQPSAGDEKEMMEERTEWLDRWMAAKQWETESRGSTDKKDPIKTVEVDTSRPYTSYGSAPPRSYGRRSLHHYRQPPSPIPNHFSSPLHRPNPPVVHSPITPSPSKTRPIQVRSASPRSHRGDDRFYSAANTPCLSSATLWTAQRHHANTVGPASTMIPNYMAATESARARARSQSAPRQRASTPERERGGHGAKKRLSYPEQQQHQPPMGYNNHHTNHANLKSPSFKSAYGAYAEEHRSNLSCYTESMAGGGEISPCSTTDMRWFR
ncbi:hypothetical protein MLD38_039207 [Melastoma candidum]|uniref:Uncharacterized protein n=1 Tax=Melastoma candidum TaxID=119954 RepID=A0ACB9L3Q4_9MYRT|nr:hypothetical protein MLD38_039207 [Melastoma candidum]